MSAVIRVPLEGWRPRPSRRSPRVPQRVVVFLGWRETLSSLAITVLFLAAVAALWTPVIIAIIQMCRHLHAP